MYNMYIQMYNSDYYQRFRSGEQVEPLVKYEFFRWHFNNNFNFSFGSARSDTCQTCDKLQNLIQCKHDDEIKSNLKRGKETRLTKVKLFYLDLKESSSKARTNSKTEILYFDFKQNMPLPHISCGNVLYKWQLWCYNFCIYSGKRKHTYILMYDKKQAKKRTT